MVKKKSFHLRKKFIVFSALVAAVLLVGGYLYYRHNTHTPQITTTPSTTQTEDMESAQRGESQKNAGSTQTTPEASKQTNTSSPEGVAAAKPEGNFVSNHHVLLGDSVESICTTTRGATCEITFKFGGVVKSLGIKTVNQAGSASWTWTPVSIGLTPGSWEITATAALNSAQVVSVDPMKLEVGQ